MSGGSGPVILAIDTSSDWASIALLMDGSGEMLVETMHSTDGHAHKLFPVIAALLARAGLTLDGVDCFAAGAGPGSFTGVRVALSAAKGLAEATGKPMAAVSNLQALAWFGTAALRAVYLDARRGEVFGALYDASLALVGEETVGKYEAWAAGLPADAERITAEPGREMARAVAAIAAARLRAGMAVDPAAVDANYVRRSDAELRWVDGGG